MIIVHCIAGIFCLGGKFLPISPAALIAENLTHDFFPVC